MTRRKILTVVGARPQFIKAAALSAALGNHSRLTELVVHTGQHFDDNMSAVFFNELELEEPAYNLGIADLPHGAMVGRMVEGLENIILEEQPSAVLVYGDTNSTLAGAIAAAKSDVPLFHVEAGLRSFNRAMPEETNRVLADHVSTLLFCPTRTAVENLRREGITAGVLHVGDVMYDVALSMARRAQSRSFILNDLSLTEGDYALATVHRAENTNSAGNLARVIDYLKARTREGRVVLPLHPRTATKCKEFGLELDPIFAIAPVGYLDMTRLIIGCREVLTDSGGLQKEAYFHNKPCVTMRGETEWLETIECGWNRLWSQPEYAPRREITDYGDGGAARKILNALECCLVRSS
jgi:UDP-GlcNAc3NAcA epimerase